MGMGNLITEPIISLKIKPYYESIQSIRSTGLDLDIILYKKIKN